MILVTHESRERKMEPHEKIMDLFFIELRKIFVLLGHDFYRQAEFNKCLLSYGSFSCIIIKNLIFHKVGQTESIELLNYSGCK